MTVIELRAASALTLFLLSLPAAGQNGQQPVIVTPPVGDFSLPPSGSTPAPRATPSPAATPAVIPAPIPIVTPTPRRPARRPAPAPVTRPAPAATRPAATPTPLATPSVEVTLTPQPARAPIDEGSSQPGWLWPMAGGALLLVLGGLGGWLLGRRRRARLEDAAAAQPVAVPAPPVTPAPTPSPPAQPQTQSRVAATPPPEGMLVAELRPLRAAIRDGLVTLDFELFVQNRGAEGADNIRAVLALMGANAEQDAQIARFHASARMAAGSAPFSIAPGGVFMLNGQVSLPDAQMPAVNVRGKPMFVPIVPVALRWYAGLSIKTLRDAFMVGTVPAAGSDRLGPLWVERAASGFGALGARRYLPKQG